MVRTSSLSPDIGRNWHHIYRLSRTTSVSRILGHVFLFSWIDRLDSIGIAGFGHDFKALEGHESTVAKVFNGFSDDIGNGVLASIFPFLDNLPTKRSRMMGQMKKATTAIACKLLEDCEKMKAGSQNVQDRSILGLLCAFQLYSTCVRSLFMLRISQRTSRRCDFQVDAWRSCIRGTYTQSLIYSQSA